MRQRRRWVLAFRATPAGRWVRSDFVYRDNRWVPERDEVFRARAGVRVRVVSVLSETMTIHVVKVG